MTGIGIASCNKDRGGGGGGLTSMGDMLILLRHNLVGKKTSEKEPSVPNSIGQDCSYSVSQLANQ